MTLQKLNELAYESLPYPDHSSDFSPTDYHFFKHIDNILQEVFDNQAATKNAFEEFIASEFYASEINRLVPY
uniref:Histone-lysine N-methyltransferase SETMAR n=1 Tax=Heterorhabditis bacteriophora TaxID=37862 RepID=A0A1I7X1G8_HETBA